jgi:diguanylate cyclase (GGDEF)-like protein
MEHQGNPARTGPEAVTQREPLFTCIQALLTALAVILLLASLSAHGESYPFHNYQRPEGLENLNLHCITQDHKGQLWLCTENGVFRFDGARMTRVPTFEDHDLSFIQAMQEDDADRLWISSTHELIYLDAAGVVHHPAIPRFGLQQAAVTAIATFPGDKDEVFLLADRQVYRIHSADKGATWQETPVFSDAAAAAHPGLKAIDALAAMSDSAGDPAGRHLWMDCGGKLCSAEPDGKSLHVWGPEAGVGDDAWQMIFRDHRGRIWARGLEHMISLAPGAPRFTSEERGLNAKSFNMRAPSIAEDAEGRILTNLSSGIARLDGDQWHIFGTENNLPQEQICNLTFDRQGSLWFGVTGHGLMRWVGYGNWEQWKARDGVGAAEVWGMDQDAHGTLWVATGIDLMHLPAGVNRRAEPQASGHAIRQAGAVIVDPAGHVWVGDTPGTIKVYDPVTHNLRVVASGLSTVYNLTLDTDGAIWVSSKNGLFRLEAKDGYRKLENSFHGAPMPAGGFYQVRVQKGRSYFQGEKGIFTLNAQGAFVHVKMPEGLRCVINGPIAVGPDGTIWLQGESSALVHLRVHGDQAELIERVSAPQVTSPSVYQISFDQRGWLWVGTDRGLNVYDGHRWIGLTTEDGLVWDDTDTDSFHASPDGSVWIGTSGGLSHLMHPEKIFETQPLTVDATNARIGATPVSIEGATKVKWRDRGALTVELGVSNPSRASAVRYRFRMEGLENEWQDTDEHTIRYSTLQPGRYRLAVMAVDPSRHQETAPIYIQFRLLPPWWRTTWFLCSLAVTMACLVGLASWWRVSSLIAQQQHLEELVRERTRQLELEKKELIEARLALVEQASRDGLTGLLNRSAIFEVLTTEIIYANEKGTPLAIVLADLDHFKRINDTYGHQVGDAVLRECARRFNQATRPTDYVGRYGGEELLLIMPGLSPENSMERLENLRATIAHELFDCDGIGLPVTCSFGVAWIDGHVRSIKPLVALADQALYAAKTRGRNRVETMASSTTGLFFPDGSGPLLASR